MNDEPHIDRLAKPCQLPVTGHHFHWPAGTGGANLRLVSGLAKELDSDVQCLEKLAEEIRIDPA
jgi:hypothetical protein